MTTGKRPALLISACLLGRNCRYDGGHCALPEGVQRALNEACELVPVCPEEEGGLPTPRIPAEIQGGTGAEVLAGEACVRNQSGEDVTSAYLRGAARAEELARRYRVGIALLKARSPACGTGEIYDGSFSGRLKPGDGVAAARLRQLGLRLFSEEQIGELLQELGVQKSDSSKS